MDEQFVLICCSEIVSLGVWSCHVELEVDCRLVGRWFEELLAAEFTVKRSAWTEICSECQSTWKGN